MYCTVVPIKLSRKSGDNSQLTLYREKAQVPILLVCVGARSMHTGSEHVESERWSYAECVSVRGGERGRQGDRERVKSLS